METSFTAFISLGFACGGPEMGDYGEFSVDLTEEELEKINEIVKEDTKGYKRFIVEKRYPELHEKLVSAAQGLVRDVLVHDAVTFMEEPISDEDDAKLETMTYHEQADYLAENYGLEPDSLDGAAVCYYLCKDELPFDYESRHQR